MHLSAERSDSSPRFTRAENESARIGEARAQGDLTRSGRCSEGKPERVFKKTVTASS
ncbi:hypothetical protein FTUN_3789 [Frigoriglobus tundricola]|uniref:Uncharacterized protein n=1 Tax=Frigoriglobus tundricola TaxID=2774151 RepID=A0A6M5YTH5_9BACT|nr:hypothetical protein FTUN_3789 [Frigoriglobus tundricola]